MKTLLVICLLAPCGALVAAPVHLVDEPPVAVQAVGGGVFLVDFGNCAFGNIRLLPGSGADGAAVTVHFGEALKDGRVLRKPPGSVRYAVAGATLDGASVVVAPPADQRNTQKGKKGLPPAILTPADWGVVLPFRWVEVEGWKGPLKPSQIVRQAGYSAKWDDRAASFRSSDEIYQKIWELCRHSIKATTFAGIYVDGDRERIPYEADAYLNQLSHYATDHDIVMARETFDHLMKHPTWPTEWAYHMIFMAHADWMHTGDLQWLAPRLKDLDRKLLLERVGEAGLIVSNDGQMKRDDIVDWPVAERDGYVFKPVNTVVNAFYLRSLEMMEEMAGAAGMKDEAAQYGERLKKGRVAFQEKLWNGEKGVYRDGEGTDHSSQHANLFPLAFGLVPEGQRASVAKWTGERGMACSVYAAQYLMEGLFSQGQEDRAHQLMVAAGDRSWRHMVESGATITWEAWDQKYKPNQDWNHAWGAAPANLLPRFVLGATPMEPGWTRARIRPCPGPLKSAEGKIPTPRGPLMVSFRNGGNFTLKIALPPGVRAKVELPAAAGTKGVSSGGKPVAATLTAGRWILQNDVSGNATFEVR